jgi:phosphatidylserine/phosphatidylglycerophosphate/cardiolipin synthase-like enzyme
MTIGTEPVPKFEWDKLDQFKAEKRFLDGYPPDTRTFYAPRDKVHELLVSLLDSAQNSLVLNMYGYTDTTLDDIIRRKLKDEQVYVQMSLDSSQVGSKSTKGILKKWNNEGIGNSIAIGNSQEHAISYLKVLIVDGVYTVTGSTNWSPSGQEKQDNQLTLSRNAVIAAEARAVLDRNHDYMLKQMANKRIKDE